MLMRLRLLYAKQGPRATQHKREIYNTLTLREANLWAMLQCRMAQAFNVTEPQARRL